VAGSLSDSETIPAACGVARMGAPGVGPGTDPEGGTPAVQKANKQYKWWLYSTKGDHVAQNKGKSSGSSTFGQTR
jgi:hypothetical protein